MARKVYLVKFHPRQVSFEAGEVQASKESPAVRTAPTQKYSADSLRS